MYSSYAPRIQLSVKSIHAQIVAPVLVSDNLATIWCNNNDFILIFGSSKVFTVPVGALSLYKLNSYLVVDTTTDLWSNRMIKYIGRVPHLPTDRQQTLCLFSFLWFFISSFIYFTELILAIDLQCGNAGAFRDGFGQTKGSSVYARANQFFHSLREWNSRFEASQFEHSWNPHSAA